LAWRSSVRTWAELHEQAFRRLGGCPRVIVLDNLREGVAIPDLYDPTVNPLFRDVLAHYGAVALPCPRIPIAKGKWQKFHRFMVSEKGNERRGFVEELQCHRLISYFSFIS